MRRSTRRTRPRLAVLALAFAALPALACENGTGGAGGGDSQAVTPVPCDPDDGGLELPEGFCATVVAEELGRTRHLEVRDDGDVFVARRGGEGGGGGVLALRDTTGDGKADVRATFGDPGGTGLRIRGESVYFGADDRILRYTVPAGSLETAGPPDTIVAGLPSAGGHAAKPLAFDGEGNLFVNVGSPSNSCQEEDRAEGSPGRDPCPELETRAGIWRFRADATGQEHTPEARYATGLRNTVALTTHPGTGRLYGVQHGRDQLVQSWGDLYTPEESAEKPSEEFVRIEEGDDFGWPYCYHDPELDQKVLAPEYGGDKETVGRCAEKKDPLIDFPAHWAPNALLFYTGTQFPGRYRGGAFIAFHGSWNRAPLPQQGYNVVFAPFEDGEPTGDWIVFADGFAGGEKSPGDAEARPTGLAQGPDGSLYVSDDAGGTIWRIMYRGS